MANSAQTCPIKAALSYVVNVTTTPEPTNTELLAAITTLISKIEGIDNKTDDLTEFVRQGFAHAMTEIAGVKDEVQRSEASITTRVADVQNVARTLKADLSGHIDNPGAHPHRHAA